MKTVSLLAGCVRVTLAVNVLVSFNGCYLSEWET